VERYDWPLLAVALLVALSITLVLRGLRAVLGLLEDACLRIGAWWHGRASSTTRVFFP
jgi:hypothetical protein